MAHDPFLIILFSSKTMRRSARIRVMQQMPLFAQARRPGASMQTHSAAEPGKGGKHPAAARQWRFLSFARLAARTKSPKERTRRSSE